MTDQAILDILLAEVKPALGCTGPISVAFAAAAAKDAVGGTPLQVRVLMDKDTYKNSIAVVTPGTPFMGVLKPAVTGAMYGDSSLGLEVLKTMKDFDQEKVERFAKECATVEIKWDYEGMGVYIEAYVTTENGIGHAVVAKSHANVVLLEANEQLLKKDEFYFQDAHTFETKAPIRAFKIRDFYRFAKQVDREDISFLDEALRINRALSEAGLKGKLGAGIGAAIQTLPGDPIYLRAKVLAAAASDARMSGENLSAMSCVSSGNVGITASVPLIPIAEAFGCSHETLLRAVALSYLMTIYIKSHIGRLSAMCACAIAASIGIGCGVSFLLDDDYDKIEMTIKNIVGSIGGVLCDGAKFGCAMKLSTAVGVAIESARMASIGAAIPDGDGIVCYSADDTLAMLGRIASNGMLDADAYMCKEIIEREQHRE